MRAAISPISASAMPAVVMAGVPMRSPLVTNGDSGSFEKFTVTDPDTYYEPWSAMRRFRRVQQEYTEEACAENNQHLFDYNIPTAKKADF